MFKCTFEHTPFGFFSPIFYITIYFTFRCALLFVCCQLFSLRALINVFIVNFIVFIFLFRTNNHKISHNIPLHRLLLLFPFYQCAVEKGSPLLQGIDFVISCSDLNKQRIFMFNQILRIFSTILQNINKRLLTFEIISLENLKIQPKNTS